MFQKPYALLVLLSFILMQCAENEVATYRIGFSQCTMNDQWRKAMLSDMERELSFQPHLALTMADAEGSTQRQIEQIEQLINSSIDLLIVSPNEAGPITAVVEKAFQAGLPVIVLDRKTDSELYTAYIGGDNYDIGYTAGKYIGTLLQGQGKIMEIWGLEGSSPAIARHQGFKEALALYPSIKAVHSIDGKWQKSIASAQMQLLPDSVLQGLDLVFAHNDVMALGAYEVCKKKGYNELQFIGIDGLSGPGGGIQFVLDELLTATFLYPTGGEEVIRIASRILTAQPFEKENLLHTTVIDSTNVRIMKMQADKITSQQQNIHRLGQRMAQQLEVYQNQKTMLIALTISLVLAIVFAARFLLALRENKEINQQLKRKNAEVEEQRSQVEQMAMEAEEATKAKFQFFTNISHEFRTPLTLILSPLEELLNSKTISFQNKKDLQLIHKNALRLLRLINQLMDFRKIENRKMRVHATEKNMVAVVREVLEAFENMSQKRQIQLQLLTNTEHVPVWIDTEKIDKVLFNLLSNAFKFTQDSDKIGVVIEHRPIQGEVKIRVEDNGRGMSAPHAAQAFERFYQGEQYQSMGTGLGLSLSKELIELHKGTITVTSQKGVGTSFEITLPLGNTHFDESELGHSDKAMSFEEIQTFIAVEDETPALTNSEPLNNEASISLLVIEDNPDLQSFLQEKFSKNYEVIAQIDGAKGLQTAFDHIPDLIICDVNLPSKDGFAIAQTLKSDMRTSHIPIIMLTAKGEVAERLEGIQAKVDAYLAKPFNFQVLQETVRALLWNRQVLRNHFTHELHIETPSKGNSPLDKKFISEFVAIVEQYLGNADFQVNDLCEAMGMSRVQLYRKTKALLGYSVNDYIKGVRLKEAKRLLGNTDKSIAEIAYEVGFSSPAYFSTAFKTSYQISPTTYREQLG